MIHISNTVVFGFKPALHGMRNPKESWKKSDSKFYDEWKIVSTEEYLPRPVVWETPGVEPYYKAPECPLIGRKDGDLMRRLIIAGPEHRKFLRAIDVWAFIEPDRGCWQEIDTYKIGTVRNSCSTMHKLGTRPLTEDDFYEGIVLPETLERLNTLGAVYRDTKDFKLVERMKRIIPEGYIQGADYKMSYENALNMFGQRFNHRLPEWRWTGGCSPTPDGRVSLCDWIWSLPYMADIIRWIDEAKEAEKEKYREEGRQQVRQELQDSENARKAERDCLEDRE
jgi:hypothetical protein